MKDLLDFIIEKAEAGKIEWDDDAPVFWGMIEELQAATVIVPTDSQRELLVRVLEHGGPYRQSASDAKALLAQLQGNTSE